MSAHTHKFDMTPRELERAFRIERWVIRLTFGGLLLAVMVLSFLAGRMS